MICAESGAGSDKSTRNTGRTIALDLDRDRAERKPRGGVAPAKSQERYSQLFRGRIRAELLCAWRGGALTP
eukprot:3488326-Rhodomonas_salina.3